MNIRLTLSREQPLGDIGPGLWRRIEDFSFDHEVLWNTFLAGRTLQDVVAKWTQEGASVKELRLLSSLFKQAAFDAEAISSVGVPSPDIGGDSELDESPSAFAILASALDLACGLTLTGEMVKFEDLNASS